MSGPPDFREKAREIQKDGLALLFTIPVALLVYSIDKAGIIGFDFGWTSLTWIAWVVLVFAMLLSGIRFWLVPNTYQRLAEVNESQNELQAKEKFRVFSKWESWNKKVQYAQIATIVIGFLCLILAHGARAYEEAGQRSLIEREDSIKAREKAIELDAREKKLNSSLPATPAQQSR